MRIHKKIFAVLVILMLTCTFSVYHKRQVMGKPWATIIAKVQARVQNFFRPAVWIPGLRNLHSHSENWALPSNNLNNNFEAILAGVVKAISEDKSGHFWTIHRNELQLNNGFIRLFVYTRAEWLDIIEISFTGKTAQVWAFSSGFLPLCIPFACLINLPLFWIPFFDMDLNEKRVDQILKAIPTNIKRQ